MGIMIDLHIHSTCSDGTDSPEKIVNLAKEANLKAFALTDHDSFDGISQAKSHAEALDLEFIPGVEVSCQHPYYENKSCHVLVYFVEDSSEPISSLLKQLRKDREQRNEKLVKRLNELGYEITLDEVAHYAKGKEIGRPHFAQAFVDKGIVSTVDEAFQKILGDDSPSYVKKAKVALSEIAKVAVDSGGAAVLAHPLRLKVQWEKLEELFHQIKDFGFTGVECIYGDYSPNERETLLKLTEESGLIPTGGSDYHGTNKKGLFVGTGRGDLNVPYELLERLKAGV